MSLAPLSSLYSATLFVTPGPFRHRQFIFGTGATAQEAVQACQEEASKMGWTSPKRWQFWRRTDPIKPIAEYRL